MVWINIICNKIKFLIINFMIIIRYICCNRKNRRKLSSDFVPLSSISVVGNDYSMHINNEDDISYNSISNTAVQPKNIQKYINQYRQQKCKQMSNESEDIQTDFFQDMEPKIIRQKKVLIKQDEQYFKGNSRLSLSSVSAVPVGNELATWEDMENTGNWDVDEENTDKILKEKRRVEREKRVAETMKKRMEKDKSRIASKIS